MKHLKHYIEEELYATPANTIGMGNPSMPALPDTPGELTNDENVGSGDIPNVKRKKKSKKIPSKDV